MSIQSSIKAAGSNRRPTMFTCTNMEDFHQMAFLKFWSLTITDTENF